MLKLRPTIWVRIVFTTVRTQSDGSQHMELAVTFHDGSSIKLDSPFFASGSTTLQFANGNMLDLETLVGTFFPRRFYCWEIAGRQLYGGRGLNLNGG